MQRKYGNDAFRYFLVRDTSFRLDASFTEPAIAERHQRRPGERLGQPAQPHARHAGPVPGRRGARGRQAGGDRLRPQGRVLGAAGDVRPAFEALQFDRALESVMEAVRKANKYIADTSRGNWRGARPTPRASTRW
ncbi:MAG: hypothetical protein M5U09_23070 [Gammaproteobacteria bacterium]|nr:hypothetical protein [Gammaproteobacteria bacterium]